MFTTLDLLAAFVCGYVLAVAVRAVFTATKRSHRH